MCTFFLFWGAVLLTCTSISDVLDFLLLFLALFLLFMCYI